MLLWLLGIFGVGFRLLAPRILQPHRQIKYRLARRMIHPVRHKIPMPFKLKLVIGLGLNRAAAGELGPDVSGPHQ